MFVLGLQGSPRKKGNTHILLSSLLKEFERLGVQTGYVDVPRKKISPCIECGTCEKEGLCPIQDDMQEVYPLLRRADVVVLATPVFFYGPTAQLKALIDRSQALWARRYVHKLVDPKRGVRRGVVIALGATKGKDLFLGVDLTAKYFFDAIGAEFDGSLVYREIESPGDIKEHPTALGDVEKKAGDLVSLREGKKKVLFLCTENACRSQMAGAFAQYHGGEGFEVESGGSEPAPQVDPVMQDVMEERGIDMAFRRPKTIEEALENMAPEMIVAMGCGEACPFVPGAETVEWDLPDPAGKPADFMREIRDEIEKRVQELLQKMNDR